MVFSAEVEGDFSIVGIDSANREGEVIGSFRLDESGDGAACRVQI